MEFPPKVKDGNIIFFQINPHVSDDDINENYIKFQSNCQEKGGKTLVIKDAGVKVKFCERPFDLTIRVLTHSEKGSEFLVFVNKRFQTMFECRGDITNTGYIGYSQAVRICDDIFSDV